MNSQIKISGKKEFITRSTLLPESFEFNGSAVTSLCFYRNGTPIECTNDNGDWRIAGNTLQNSKFEVSIDLNAYTCIASDLNHTKYLHKTIVS